MAKEPPTVETSRLTGRSGASLKASLAIAGEKIQMFKRKQVEYLLKIAKEVAGLRTHLSQDQEGALLSWLRKEMAFSFDEADAITNCPSDVTSGTQILEKSDVSLATVRAIIASDALTRSKSFIQIARGDRVDEDAVVRLRRATVVESRSPEEIERQDRKDAFEKATTELGRVTIVRLEREASTLLALLDVTFDDADNSKAMALDERRDAISERAVAVLQMVESLFGSDHPPRHRIVHIHNKGTAAASISYAWYALKDLAEGAIGEGLSESGEEHWKSIRACVEFLAGRRFSAISHASAAGVSPRLKDFATFVDVDAGVGGTALGLQASGFRAAGIWVTDADARAAMRLNRPSWNVWKYVESDFVHELRRLRKKKCVDLVTSGLPWHHYHHKKTEPDSAFKAFQRAVKAVRILSPKVFVFQAASEDPDDCVAKSFTDLGYDVRWHTVDVSRFGIVQAKARTVIVGARDGYLDNLSMPVLDPPHRKTLPEAIGDLVAGQTRVGAVIDELKSSHRKKVEDWAELCTGKFSLAPELPSRYRRRRVKRWRDRGIDITDYINRPPTSDELGSEKGFRLTGDMLGRIQSFPDKWILGKGKSNAPQIADAFPPVAAKMLGLAILSALMDVEFDYQRAVRADLLSRKKISFRRGDPTEWTAWQASWLLSDPKLAFRKSAGRQSMARRKAREDAERSVAIIKETMPPPGDPDTT
ncbi:DNA cytosine methyltransferase [Rhizobium ruizarguesonis]